MKIQIQNDKLLIPTNQTGFSLLEMLVVLVIIGLLAGLVGPRLFTQVDSAKIQTAQTQIRMLKGTLEAMRLDIGRFPTTEEGLRLLRVPPDDDSIKPFWKGPYLDEDIPLDPWNRPYQYENTPSKDGQPFVLYSYGADGQLAGVDTNADIGYLPIR
jgi:general secretion pathway protein G